MMEDREQAQLDLERGHVIPAFTLPGADGMPHSPWDYKQRENLLLLFLAHATTDEGQALLQTFARHYATFRSERCAILAISGDTVMALLQVQETLHLPFPLVADPQQKVIPRYTQSKHSSQSLILTDQYNALHEYWILHEAEQHYPVDDILVALEYLNNLCNP